MQQVTTFQDVNARLFFLSTSSAQPLPQSAQDFIPTVFTLPTVIDPRPGFEDGIVWTLDGLLNVFCFDYIQIANPLPDFQA